MRTDLTLTDHQTVQMTKQTLNVLICGLDRRYRAAVAINVPGSEEYQVAKLALDSLQRVGYAVETCDSTGDLELLLGRLMLAGFKPDDLEPIQDTLLHHEGVFVKVIGDDTIEFVKKVKLTTFKMINGRIQDIQADTAQGVMLRKQDGWTKRDHLLRLQDHLANVHYPWQLVAVKRYLMVSYERPEQFARELDASQTVDQMARCMLNRVQYGKPVVQ